MTGSVDRATIADLADRLARHDRDQDDATLLDESAHRAALTLHAAVLGDPAGRTDATPLRVLGQWFLRRYELLPPGAGPADLRSARLYAGLLRDLGAAELPDDLRALLDGVPDIAVRTNEVAMSMLDRFEKSGDLRWITAAAQWIGDLEAMLPTDHPLRGDIRSSFHQLAMARFTVDADPAIVDTTVRSARESLAGTPIADADAADRLAVLCWALVARYEAAGAPGDLDEAHDLAEKVLREKDIDPPATVLGVLGYVLRCRFERGGRTTDLDRAVTLSRAAVRAMPSGHPIQVQLRYALTLSLTRRFEHLGREADLTEAIEVSRAMRPTLGPSGPARCGWLANLAILLFRKSMRTGSATDLDEAVTASREAVGMSAGLGILRHWVLGNHATLLAVRFGRDGRHADLDEAIRSCREAIATTSANGAQAGMHRSTLARLLTLAARTGEPGADLDEAASVGRQALSKLSPGHPQRAAAATTLAAVYHQRHQATGAAEDLDTAIGLWRSAAASPFGKPAARMQAVLDWRRALLRERDLARAAEPAELGVSLLPVLAWRGLDRARREERLADVTGLASEAAALAIELGRPERAVELVEQGRAVLWGQAVQTRGDLSALHAVAPELAGRLDETRRALNTMGTTGEAGQGDPDEVVREYRALVERWDTLLGQARSLPGFASFLGATPFSALRVAAAAGPVVIVNVTGPRCDALIVRESGVQAVPLRWLSLADAHRRAEALLAAVAEAEQAGPGPALTHLRQTLGSLLRWLWDAVAGPVLAELDGPGPHRVWWCPTGPLTVLPLHAAGRYGSSPRWDDRSRPTVPDRTISSYTTGLGALIRARQRPAVADPALLAVGMPRTPDRAPLPAVVEELRRITDRVERHRTLIGAAAAPDTVLAELGRHAWAHFACHATQRVDRPGDSSLHLFGGDLSVLRLADREVPGAEFAYLSACRTAAGGMALADEAINLAAALQLAGYRHVIGTLWAVADTDAAEIADDVYRTLTAGGRPSTTATAHALADATARLRAAHPDRPDAWAAFVHLGP
jgi:tetratricopeptide (TPR) repeat protein